MSRFAPKCRIATIISGSLKSFQSAILPRVRAEKATVKAAEKETVTETVTEEVPKFRYEFPLNAQAIGGMSDEAAEGVYKQYVISGFSTKGDEEEK